jgi:hypothetical protein
VCHDCPATRSLPDLCRDDPVAVKSFAPWVISRYQTRVSSSKRRSRTGSMPRCRLGLRWQSLALGRVVCRGEHTQFGNSGPSHALSVHRCTPANDARVYSFRLESRTSQESFLAATQCLAVPLTSSLANGEITTPSISEPRSIRRRLWL